MKTSKMPYSVSLQSLMSEVKKQEEREKHVNKPKSKSENEKNDLKK
jgi:hypothetical protein